MSETSAPEQCIYSPDLEAAAETLLRRAAEQRLRIVTAESCTGGALAALLTDIEGVSHVFERGFAVYCDKAKQECLDVPIALIEKHSAVSEPVALAMAQGALAHSGANIAISITGYAGAPPPGEGEEGHVFICVAQRRGGHQCKAYQFGAIGRSPVRMAALRAALDQLGWAMANAGGAP